MTSLTKYFNNSNNNLTNDLFGFLWDDFFSTSNIYPKLGNNTSVEEKEDKYIISLVAPGVKKEDFKIEVEKNILKISYEQTNENKNKYLKTFSRTWTLPTNTNIDLINAKYEAGILYVSVPKPEEQKTEVKCISIN